MNLNGLLKSAFSTALKVVDSAIHGPSYPHPKVRKLLEQKGYQYIATEQSMPTPYMMPLMPSFSVLDASGTKVRYSGHEPKDLLYRQDYKEALQQVMSTPKNSGHKDGPGGIGPV